MKRILAMVLSLALVATMAIGGSIAYLTDTDEAVNVAVIGNVDIEQYEKDHLGNELGVDENGVTTLGKLYPAYYTDENNLALVDTNGYWTDVTGALDKVVTVENTGKSDAFIRTWFAFEADNEEKLEYIIPNWNDNLETVAKVEWIDKTVVIGDSDYKLCAVTYKEAYAATETTPASLLQVAMNKAADNDYVEHFGDTYEILVFSQAVQTENLSQLGAAGALNEAFNGGAEPSADNHPWKNKTLPDIPEYVSSAAALKAAFAAGGDITLTDDIKLAANDTLVVPKDVTVNLHLNGNTLSGSSDPEEKEASFITNKGTLNIVDEGKITFAYTGTANNHAKVGYYTINNYGTLNIAEATIQNTTEGVWDANNSMLRTAFAIDHKDGELTVESGTIEATGRSLRIAGYAGSPTATLNGGSFVGQVWVQGLDNKTTALTINGGSFERVGGDGSSVFVGNSLGTNVVNITGGTLKNKLGANNPNGISVTGGTFGANPSEYVSKPYAAIEQSNGTWTIGGKQVADAASLIDALSAGYNVELTQDIGTVVNTEIAIGTGEAVTLDLNGHTLSGSSDTFTGSLDALMRVTGTLNITDGQISFKHTGSDAEWNNGSAVIHVSGNGVLNLSDVTIKHGGGTSMSYCLDMTNSNGATYNIEDCTLESTYIPVRVFNNMKNAHNITIKNSTLNGKYAFWVQYHIADGWTADEFSEKVNLNIYNNGNTFKCEEGKKGPVLYGFNSAVYFNEKGEQLQ